MTSPTSGPPRRTTAKPIIHDRSAKTTPIGPYLSKLLVMLFDREMRVNARKPARQHPVMRAVGIKARQETRPPSSKWTDHQTHRHSSGSTTSRYTASLTPPVLVEPIAAVAPTITRNTPNHTSGRHSCRTL